MKSVLRPKTARKHQVSLGKGCHPDPPAPAATETELGDLPEQPASPVEAEFLGSEVSKQMTSLRKSVGKYKKCYKNADEKANKSAEHVQEEVVGEWMPEGHLVHVASHDQLLALIVREAVSYHSH